MVTINNATLHYMYRSNEKHVPHGNHYPSATLYTDTISNDL